MKKVYALLGAFEDGDFSIVAVFSTRKKAVEAELKEEQSFRFCYTAIKEIVVDEYKEYR